MGAQADVARAEVEIADATMAIAAADAATESARAALARAMGLAAGVRIEITDDEPQPGPIPAATAEPSAPPEVAALEAQAASDRADAEGASRGYYPDVTVSAGYGVSDSAFFPTRQAWSIGASVDFPIFSWAATGPSVARAEAQARAVEARIDTLQQDRALEAERARLALEEARTRLDASGALIASAAENLRVAEGLYQEGSGSMIELVDARAAVQRAQIARVVAVRDVALAAARYRWAVGEDPAGMEGP